MVLDQSLLINFIMDKGRSDDKREDQDNSRKVAGIAVIGAGWWGQARHLPQLLNHPKAKIVAIVEPNRG